MFCCWVNRSGRYLELVEYAVGGRRYHCKPEGRAWKIFAAEMRKVVAFFGFSLGAGSIALLPRHLFGGSPSFEAGGSWGRKEMMLGGGSKTFQRWWERRGS